MVVKKLSLEIFSDALRRKRAAQVEGKVVPGLGSEVGKGVTTKAFTMDARDMSLGGSCWVVFSGRPVECEAVMDVVCCCPGVRSVPSVLERGDFFLLKEKPYGDPGDLKNLCMNSLLPIQAKILEKHINQ
ncbi:hypothetical protein NDU88_007529 [Pleurodeles waltl]|uniref:Uncharacterized protein n=1 Tax=Pleurodeles waltl TaxID=8319 RepID=A0AAV7NY84_PLEWA|nr:hypothetical protein NDU88_007529 [Pleurodeles waltl]